MVEIKYLQEFERQAKALRKRYRSFEADYADFLESIEHNPFQGTSLGAGIYKVRMQITSKGKGKSGGARVLTWAVTEQDDDIIVTLLTIFDKSDFPNVSDRYIKSLVREATSQL